MPRVSHADVHGKRLFLFVTCSLLVANALPWICGHVLGLGTQGSIRDELWAMLHLRQWTDSWQPMMQSLDFFRSHPEEPIYTAPVYNIFIYPLTSLLPLSLLRACGVGDASLLRLLTLASFAAVLAIPLLALSMGRRLLAGRGQRMDAWSVAAVVPGCLFCYPVLKSYSLGNAQTFLSFGFVLLMWLWSAGHERAGGAVSAVLACVKPQFALLLVWMAVRRRWGAALAFLVTGAVLLGCAVLVFGWRNNLDYLHVLASLSRKAQAHFSNQSMFGTLNRMIGNGENLGYTPHLFTPYIAWVYRVTVLTAAVLIGGTLFFPWGRLRGSAGDLGALGLASVAASPMAWEHHYGIVLGIYAWLWFAYGCAQRRRPWLLGLSFALVCNYLSVLNLLAAHKGLNVLQSYVYFGALMLLAVLCRTAWAVSRDEADPVP